MIELSSCCCYCRCCSASVMPVTLLAMSCQDGQRSRHSCFVTTSRPTWGLLTPLSNSHQTASPRVKPSGKQPTGHLQPLSRWRPRGFYLYRQLLRHKDIIIIIIIIIIIKLKRENMHPDRCGNTCRQKCCAKGSGKEVNIQELCIEIRRMWNLAGTIIPVITGATWIVTRSLRKNLEAVPGKHSIDSIQKTAILGTSHIIWKYCSVKLEAWAVGITAGSREVPGRKGLWQEISISNNNNNLTI